MCVNNLPKVITRQCTGAELNLRLWVTSGFKVRHVTVRLPSHARTDAKETMSPFRPVHRQSVQGLSISLLRQSASLSVHLLSEFPVLFMPSAMLKTTCYFASCRPICELRSSVFSASFSARSVYDRMRNMYRSIIMSFEPADDGADWTWKLLQALIIVAIVITLVIVATVVFVLLYKYRCYKVRMCDVCVVDMSFVI